MKTKNKVLILSLCAMLLVVASVLGTLAYLTAQDSVTNTFTVGNVTLGNDLEGGLDEALVNLGGEPVDEDGNVVALPAAPRVDRNTYKLVPGHEYTKDPTVHVNVESEACFIFVKIENGIAGIEAGTIEAQVLANGWEKLEGVEGVNNVYYRVWSQPVDLPEDGTDDLPVFGSFEIKGDVDAEDLETYDGATINVTAYAIQKDGFEDHDNDNDNAIDAWAALQEQYPTPTENQ